LQESYDTNERLAEQVSLDVPAGHEIYEGQTLTLSDGRNTVTFEFDDLAINNGVQAGHVRIAYNTSDSDIVMARRIRDVINSAPVQSLVRRLRRWPTARRPVRPARRIASTCPGRSR